MIVIAPSLKSTEIVQGVTGLTSKANTQSDAPSWFAPGGVNCRVPEFVNGEPEMTLKLPLLGSYHAAVTGLLNAARLTVRALPATS